MSQRPNEQMNNKSKLPVPTCAVKTSANVPDFHRLHKKWESEMDKRKNELKKKVTVPKEFKFSSLSSATTSILKKSSNVDSAGNRNDENVNLRSGLNLAGRRPAPGTIGLHSSTTLPSKTTTTIKNTSTSYKNSKSLLVSSLTSINQQQQHKNHLKKPNLHKSQPSSTAFKVIEKHQQQEQQIKFEKCDQSLREIMKPAQSQDPEVPIRRRSLLGPPQRPQSSSSQLKQTITHPTPTNQHHQTEQTQQQQKPREQLSKLERRITSHFSRPTRQNSAQGDLTEDTPNHNNQRRQSVSYRAGLALIEIKNTPGKKFIFNNSHSVEFDSSDCEENGAGKEDNEEDEDEWVRRLALDVANRTANATTMKQQPLEVYVPTVSPPPPLYLPPLVVVESAVLKPQIPLIFDNVPTPPPPISNNAAEIAVVTSRDWSGGEANEEQIKALNRNIFQYKTVENADLTFNTGINKCLVPILPDSSSGEKSMFQLKRSPAELFQDFKDDLDGDDDDDKGEDGGGGVTKAIFTAPEFEDSSDDEGHNQLNEDDTCARFFNSVNIGNNNNNNGNNSNNKIIENKSATINWNYNDNVDLELGLSRFDDLDEEPTDVNAIMKQLADLDHLEKALMNELKEE